MPVKSLLSLPLRHVKVKETNHPNTVYRVKLNVDSVEEEFSLSVLFSNVRVQLNCVLRYDVLVAK